MPLQVKLQELVSNLTQKNPKFAENPPQLPELPGVCACVCVCVCACINSPTLAGHVVSLIPKSHSLGMRLVSHVVYCYM